MAYTRAWNEATPAGTLPADQIDTAIQDDKIAVRERLEQVIPDFGNDLIDPKVLAAGSARISVGTEAARPANPTLDGEVYFATDTETLSIGSGGAWIDYKKVLIGDESALPANPEEGQVFFAMDTGKVFLDDAGTWLDTSPRHVQYDDSLGVGAKVTATQRHHPLRMVSVHVTDAVHSNTSSLAEFVIDLDEFNEDVTELAGVSVMIDTLRNVTNLTWFIHGVAINAGANTVRVYIGNADDADVNPPNDPLDAYAIMWFKT